MNYTIYINILKDTLKKKMQLLDKIVEETTFQEVSLSLDEIDIGAFQEGVERKDFLIEQLNKLDDGFELVYERFGEAIKANKSMFQGDILEIQDYIRKIMEKSSLLQSKEKGNKAKFEKYLVDKKAEIRNFKVSNQAVSNYYKNMSESYRGEAVFLDKKK